MTYLEILGLFVSGSGTLASILGIFFAFYAKQNGKATREFIASQSKEMQEYTAKVIAEMREDTAKQNRETQKFTAEVITKLDEKAEMRHKEVMNTLEQ
jgi:ubiquinone biosynthesis protein UbiJ